MSDINEADVLIEDKPIKHFIQKDINNQKHHYTIGADASNVALQTPFENVYLNLQELYDLGILTRTDDVGSWQELQSLIGTEYYTFENDELPIIDTTAIKDKLATLDSVNKIANMVDIATNFRGSVIDDENYPKDAKNGDTVFDLKKQCRMTFVKLSDEDQGEWHQSSASVVTNPNGGMVGTVVYDTKTPQDEEAMLWIKPVVDAYENIVTDKDLTEFVQASPEPPKSNINKIWIDTSEREGFLVPTWDDFLELKTQVQSIITNLDALLAKKY